MGARRAPLAALGRGLAPRPGGRSLAILTLNIDAGRPLRLLLLGAHCDDIEIGMGGTLLEWLEAGVPLDVHGVVFTSTPGRAREARAAADAFLAGAERVTATIHSFRDGFLPYEGAAVKEAFEELRARLTPDAIFTHAREDRHQDHRTVSDLTWSTFRDHLVLEYEIPKYDGDLGQPNAFVAVSERNVERKWAYLRDCYPSQRDRTWFSESTFQGLMRLRGIESAAPSGYAEGYVARKLALDLAAPSRPYSTNGHVRTEAAGSGSFLAGGQER